jgi:uncharacterized membrane protein
MQNLVRCRSCGYIMPEGRLGDRCPACGVPRRMFEPWTDPVGQRRRARLDLDVHPIIVHFTVSFATAAFVLDLLALAAPRLLGTVLGCARAIATIGLPVTAVAAWIAGALDGTIRFRRVTTPLLVRKMALGALVVLAGAGGAAIELTAGIERLGARISLALLAAVAVGCIAALSRAGKRLLGAAFPG